MQKTITIFVILTLLRSCTDNTHYVYSPDRKQCITIMDINNERYIIIDKHYSIPDSNYVKLQIDPSVSMNDEFVGLWKTSRWDVQIVIDKSIILINKLDTSKYKFHNNLPIDRITKTPTLGYFHGKEYFHFGFTSFSVQPIGSAIIE